MLHLGKGGSILERGGGRVGGGEGWGRSCTKGVLSRVSFCERGELNGTVPSA